MDKEADLSQFKYFGEAYARLMMDLTQLAVQIRSSDHSPGRYHQSPIHYRRICEESILHRIHGHAFPDKDVFTSEMDNATSLGAALVISGKVWPDAAPRPDLGLQRWNDQATEQEMNKLDTKLQHPRDQITEVIGRIYRAGLTTTSGAISPLLTTRVIYGLHLRPLIRGPCNGKISSV